MTHIQRETESQKVKLSELYSRCPTKNMDAFVCSQGYPIILHDVPLWPSFWTNTTLISIWHRSHNCRSETKCGILSACDVSLLFNFVNFSNSDGQYINFKIIMYYYGDSIWNVFNGVLNSSNDQQSRLTLFENTLLRWAKKKTW